MARKFHDDATDPTDTPVPTDLTRLGLGIGSHPDSALSDLVADASIDAIRRRRAEVAIRRIEVTCARVLSGSVGMVVSVGLGSGEQVTGSVTEVGADYVCVVTGGGAVWVGLDAVTAVATPTDPGSAPSATPTVAARLADVMEDLALAEVDVVVTTLGGGTASGTVLSAGESIVLTTVDGFVTLRPDRIMTVTRVGTIQP